MKKLLFIICVFIGIQVLGQKWEPIYQPFDSLTNLCEQQTDDAAGRERQKHYVRLMYTIADEHPSIPSLRWRAMYWKALLLMKSGQPDSALHLARTAIKLVDAANYEYDYRRLQRIAINCSTDTIDYFSTYKAYREQLQFYEKMNDSINIANTCVTLGTIFSMLGEYQKAIDYQKRADLLYRHLGKNEYVIKNTLNIANCYQELGEHQKSTRLLKDILKDPVTLQDTAFHLEVLASVCTYHENTYEQEKYTREAYQLSLSYGRKYPILKSHINMGAFFLQQAQIDSALSFYRKASDYLKQHENKELLIPVFNGMSNCFQAKKQWDSAFIYLNTARYYEDSFKSNMLPQMYRMENRIAIDGYENTLRKQQEEANMHRLILIQILVLVILSAIFICYLLWIQRRKVLMKKRMKELENKELSTRLENEELRHRLELEAKDRELTSNAIILTEKNKVLKDLTNRINSRKEAGDIAPATALELRSRISACSGNEDSEWQNFRVHFEQVHPNFFCQLKENYPSLTENELRLCAYLRTGMERKQIATMLSIQPDTVKKNCVRMRKKFPLRTEDSLEDFLRKL